MAFLAGVARDAGLHRGTDLRACARANLLEWLHELVPAHALGAGDPSHLRRKA